MILSSTKAGIRPSYPKQIITPVLTALNQRRYVNRASAKSDAEVGPSNIPSAQALITCAFFVSKIRVYGGLCGGASARRFSEYGRTNSAQSASLLVGPNGGSSLNYSEDATMFGDTSQFRLLKDDRAISTPFHSKFACIAITSWPNVQEVLS
ncbi:hypothetical protein [Aliamphritea hakodatensis]|uniref:hypothetical protein n=1 Tax=Aliamphritea hakodatensis TaxID=2895352 RepID=UPI0022FD85F4|nr:hypothetical protein [Aliamphritea hakodatensis]